MTAKLIKICQRRTAWRKIRRPGARHASCGPSHGAAVDPQAGPTAASRPGFHLADPTTAVHHATSLTLQTRQPPPAMRPASPCSPGNRRLPCGPAHLADPATAVRPSCRPSPYRPNRCRTAQAVLTRSRRLFHGPAAPPQPKGAEGTAERARSWQGGGCGGKGSRREGTTEGRGAIGRPAAVSGMGLRRVWRSFFAGFVPFASLNIRFERVQTASQPYFYSRKRFTPRPHTHQIQPVSAPRQRSAPAGGSRDRHPLRLEDSLPFRPSVRHPETHGSGCRFVGS